MITVVSFSFKFFFFFSFPTLTSCAKLCLSLDFPFVKLCCAGFSTFSFFFPLSPPTQAPSRCVKKCDIETSKY